MPELLIRLGQLFVELRLLLGRLVLLFGLLLGLLHLLNRVLTLLLSLFLVLFLLLLPLFVFLLLRKFVGVVVISVGLGVVRTVVGPLRSGLVGGEWRRMRARLDRRRGMAATNTPSARTTAAATTVTHLISARYRRRLCRT